MHKKKIPEKILSQKKSTKKNSAQKNLPKKIIHKKKICEKNSG